MLQASRSCIHSLDVGFRSLENVLVVSRVLLACMSGFQEHLYFVVGFQQLHRIGGFQQHVSSLDEFQKPLECVGGFKSHLDYMSGFQEPVDYVVGFQKPIERLGGF